MSAIKEHLFSIPESVVGPDELAIAYKEMGKDMDTMELLDAGRLLCDPKLLAELARLNPCRYELLREAIYAFEAEMLNEQHGEAV